MAEKTFFTEGPCLNIITFKEEFADLMEMCHPSRIDIGWAWGTGPNRRLRKSDPLFRNASIDHPTNPSIPDGKGLEPTPCFVAVPEHLVSHGILAECKARFDRNGSESQTAAYKFPSSGRHRPSLHDHQSRALVGGDNT
jgi:hypothetical protein